MTLLQFYEKFSWCRLYEAAKMCPGPEPRFTPNPYEEVRYDDPKANCFCFLGAIRRIAGDYYSKEPEKVYIPIIYKFKEVVHPGLPINSTYPIWHSNDNCQTWDEAKAFLERTGLGNIDIPEKE